MPTRDAEDLQTFEALRPDLIALSYRMLGDAGRAQDFVQEAWLRWHARTAEVVSPRAFLIAIVTRLCLNELASARARGERSTGMRLPEPVDLGSVGIGPVDALDSISMAFMVVLERLTPAERAVLLLHDVFDLPHQEIATLVSRTPEGCRKLLERARAKVASGRKVLSASREEHERLLYAFMHATVTGDTGSIVAMLAADAALLTDGGPEGRRVGRLRNLDRPLVGAARIAAFLVAASRVAGLTSVRCELNGQPALLFLQNGQRFGALMIEVQDGKIQSVYFQADAARLRFSLPAAHPAEGALPGRERR